MHTSNEGGHQDDDDAVDDTAAFDLGRGVSNAHKNLLRYTNNFPFFPAICFPLFSVLNVNEQVQESNIYVKYRSLLSYAFEL